MHYVYILRSLKDNRHYVGMTTNLENRLRYHNCGKVKSTKNRIPFIIIHQEEYTCLIEARIREKFLKSYKGSKEKTAIIKNWEIV